MAAFANSKSLVLQLNYKDTNTCHQFCFINLIKYIKLLYAVDVLLSRANAPAENFFIILITGYFYKNEINSFYRL